MMVDVAAANAGCKEAEEPGNSASQPRPPGIEAPPARQAKAAPARRDTPKAPPRHADSMNSPPTPLP